MNYLWEGLIKLHYQLPFTSFFIFSFLTLDETYRGTRRLVFREQNKHQTEKIPGIVPPRPAKLPSCL